MTRTIAVSLVLAMTLLAPPAAAQQGETNASPPPLEAAALRVREYVGSIPNMPKDILVIPAAGDVLWPGAAPTDNVRAEVWVVVPRDNPRARPLMMFAVLPRTGEVYAMFMANLQQNPRYR